MHLNIQGELKDRHYAALFAMSSAQRELGLLLLRRKNGQIIADDDVAKARAQIAEYKQAVDDAEAMSSALDAYKQEIRERVERENLARKQETRKVPVQEYSDAMRAFEQTYTAFCGNQLAKEKAIELGTALWELSKAAGGSCQTDCKKRFARLGKLPELVKLR